MNIELANCPHTSIALPVYNGANYLREALDSVQARTFANFEIVISDNASTGATMDICQEYARRDSPVKVNRSKEFLQQADNVSRAVALCSAEWVKLFCHDDLMAADYISSVTRTISNSDSEVGLNNHSQMTTLLRVRSLNQVSKSRLTLAKPEGLGNLSCS